MKLVLQHYQEVERSKMAVDKVETTYQTKLIEYEVQAMIAVDLIK